MRCRTTTRARRGRLVWWRAAPGKARHARASASLAEILRRQDQIDEDTLRRSLLRAMASRRLHGEVLVRDFHLSPTVIGRALRAQLMLRLSVLEELADA